MSDDWKSSLGYRLDAAEEFILRIDRHPRRMLLHQIATGHATVGHQTRGHHARPFRLDMPRLREGVVAMTDDLRLRNDLATVLRAIVDLYGNLEDEAAHRYASKDMPGGDALVMLGPAANLAAWENQIDTAERLYFEGRAAWIELDDLDTDPAPPLLVLASWVDIIREERGQPTDLRATVKREADYLVRSLDWIVENFLPVDELARDLSALRGRLEAVLKDGTRFDTSATACFKDDDEAETGRCGGQLVRRTLQRRDCLHVARAIDMSKGAADPVIVLRRMLLAFPEDEAEHKRCDQGGRDDVYRCRKCEKFYTESEYWLAVREHYERQAG